MDLKHHLLSAAYDSAPGMTLLTLPRLTRRTLLVRLAGLLVTSSALAGLDACAALQPPPPLPPTPSPTPPRTRERPCLPIKAIRILSHR
jgi:hypothetical protein